MFSIFNGKSRQLGKPAKQDIFITINVELRHHLASFKGARLSVLMCIALHADKDGWAFPSVNTIRKETGYTRETVFAALTDLCTLTVDSHRLLLRHQPINVKRGVFESNRYLLFPSPEDVAKWEKVKSPSTEKPDTVRPSSGLPNTVKPNTENPYTKKNQLNKNHDKEEPMKNKSATHLSSSANIDDFVRQISLVFDYWKLASGHSKAKVAGKRERAIRARLKDGFTVHQIKLGIEGCLDSDFHKGDNDRDRIYDDIEMICRDASKLEPLINDRIEKMREVYTSQCCDSIRSTYDGTCKNCGSHSDMQALHDDWMEINLKTRQSMGYVA